MFSNGYPRSGLARYVIGASLARTASEGVAIALVLLVRASGSGPGTAGLLIAAWSAPSVLSGAVVGHALDRSARPRRLLVIAGALAMVTLGLDALLAGRLPGVALIALTAVGGVTLPLFTGGLSSRLPAVIAPAALSRAHALDSTSYTVAGIAGPALVAGLAALVSARVALGVPALAVLAGALTVPVGAGPATPPPPRPHPRARLAQIRPSARATLAALAQIRPSARATLAALAQIRPSARATLAALAQIRRSARATLAALVRTPPLRAATLASTLAAGGWGGLEIAAVAIAAATGSAHLAGVDLAVLGVAALVAGLALTRHPLGHPERALPLCLLAMTSGLLVAAVAPGPLVVAVGFAVFGAGDGVLLPAVLAIRTRDAPPGMTGAVFTTAASLKTAAGAVGAAVAGGVATGLGARGLLVSIAAVQLGAAALSRAKSGP